ncbi:hypothetical protein [Photobacterium sp. R1]
MNINDHSSLSNNSILESLFDDLDVSTHYGCTTKSEREASFRAKRKLRKQALIKMHHEICLLENERERKTKFEFGFKARRLLQNGEWVTLPQEFGRILAACQEFIEHPNRFPSLYAWGGEAINNVQCRILVARVLACILPHTDLIGGRVGFPTEAGMKTISYDKLQEEYALRFGEFIAPKSFDKAIKYLKRAGYFHSERINVSVDDVEGTVRSAPAYKQFTEKFFSDLKVVRYSNICQLILETRNRQLKQGKRFEWVNFRTIAAGIQSIFNAQKLNGFSQTITDVFNAYSLPNMNPH